MRDLASCDPRLLDDLGPVIGELTEIISPDRVMLIGARCRDVLHWAVGRSDLLRATDDADLALAMDEWRQFTAIVDRFAAVGNTGHRFEIGGVVTDVIPFGSVENPPGTSSHPPGHEDMNVHGFVDAYASALTLPLSTSATIKIPSVAGYAVLKLHAWLDRSAWGSYKDGPDLALAVDWYSGDVERLYDPHWQNVLAGHEFDLWRTAAHVLGADMTAMMSDTELQVLRRRVGEANRDLLAENFIPSVQGFRRPTVERRLDVDALLSSLQS